MRRQYFAAAAAAHTLFANTLGLQIITNESAALEYVGETVVILCNRIVSHDQTRTKQRRFLGTTSHNWSKDTKSRFLKDTMSI